MAVSMRNHGLLIPIKDEEQYQHPRLREIAIQQKQLREQFDQLDIELFKLQKEQESNESDKQQDD